jgi:hypothetical protein
MIQLDFISQRKIKDHVLGEIVVDDKKYSYKRGKPNNVNMIIERLASLVNIRCKHYDVAFIRGKRFNFNEILSYDYCETFNSLGISCSTLNDIEKSLKELYLNLYAVLTIELIKIYLFDILTLNPGRTSNNIWVCYNGFNDMDLLINHNNEAFSSLPMCGISSYNYDLSCDVIPLVLSPLDDLDYFLSTTYPEYVEILKEMLRILTPERVLSVIEELEEENKISIPLKEVYLERYRENYNRILDMMFTRKRL